MESLLEINRRFAIKISASMAQILCYAMALLIMVVGIQKVAALGLNEANLIFGILLVLILTLQAIIVGMVVGLHARKS